MRCLQEDCLVPNRMGAAGQCERSQEGTGPRPGLGQRPQGRPTTSLARKLGRAQLMIIMSHPASGEETRVLAQGTQGSQVPGQLPLWTSSLGPASPQGALPQTLTGHLQR